MSKQPIARFTFLIDAELKKRFERACAEQDITASQMMRQLIKVFVAERDKPAKPAKPIRRRT